jgi:SAM-dependent methyltransferase
MGDIFVSVFDEYARYYDLLYREKDYQSESAYIARLFDRYGPDISSVFEIGCGTGRHALALAKLGFHIHGIDRSDRMVSMAAQMHSDLPPSLCEKLSFLKADARFHRTNIPFDAIISLFHVISYQSTNVDLTDILRSAAENLRTDGLFIFDVWYGPAVLSRKPETRIKRMEDDKIQVIRIAEPCLCPNENLVDVHYHLLIRDKSKENIEEYRETHRMRYFFTPELVVHLELAGFELLHSEAWLGGRKPSCDTWSVTYVARRRDHTQ